MRGSALSALVYAGWFVGASSALVDAGELTEVTVTANGWETSEDICGAGGCVPGNTRDGSMADMSRWACKEDIVGDNCVIDFEFEEPQDLVSMKIAFYKGDESKQEFKLRVNGEVVTKLESSGETDGYETFMLNTDETSSLGLEGLGMDGDEYMSIIEVMFMVDEDGPTPVTPTPGGPPLGLCDVKDFTDVSVSSEAWDTRTSECSPSGCFPANTRDGSLEPASRWSCKEDLHDDQCVIEFDFAEPQDIEEMQIAFYKGDMRTREFKLLINGKVINTFESSGETTDFEIFKIDASDVSSIALEGLGMAGDEWLSIIEVKFMVTCTLTLPPAMSPSPTTPAPAPACVPALSFILEWFDRGDLDLFVSEPSDTLVYYDNPVGDVGFLDQDVFDGSEPETYSVRSGLSVEEDEVLGSYEATVAFYYSDSPVEWRLTAEVAGETLWVEEGVFTSYSFFDASETFMVELDSYVSDPNCIIAPPTPAPTPAPSRLCDPSFEIQLDWDDPELDLDLRVLEPTGTLVTWQNERGDVGYIENFNHVGSGPETYYIPSDVSADNPDIYGDYEASVAYWSGDLPAHWSLTAKLLGEVLWTETGMLTMDMLASENYSAIVDTYEEPDCEFTIPDEAY